jgi:hypothetical protein
MKKTEFIEILKKEKELSGFLQDQSKSIQLKCGKNNMSINFNCNDDIDFICRHVQLIGINCQIIYSSSLKSNSKHTFFMEPSEKVGIFEILDNIKKDGFDVQNRLPKRKIEGFLEHPRLFYENPHKLEFEFLSPEEGFIQGCFFNDLRGSFNI